mmetsp:Transcript_4015/g.12443  ORF Transcript_4015/g.12443 Transcript_4015/m.12443 type:complete len:204 (+) Transcript_4015:591-1202(+)
MMLSRLTRPYQRYLVSGIKQTVHSTGARPVQIGKVPSSARESLSSRPRSVPRSFASLKLMLNAQGAGVRRDMCRRPPPTCPFQRYRSLGNGSMTSSKRPSFRCWLPATHLLSLPLPICGSWMRSSCAMTRMHRHRFRSIRTRIASRSLLPSTMPPSMRGVALASSHSAPPRSQQQHLRRPRSMLRVPVVWWPFLENSGTVGRQ